jgi:hypothetical protein
MTVFRLFSIGVIIACTTVAWFMLATALKVRTESTGDRLEAAVAGNLGNAMVQEHPGLYYLSSTSANMKRHIQPVRSRVNVNRPSTAPTRAPVSIPGARPGDSEGAQVTADHHGHFRSDRSSGSNTPHFPRAKARGC